MRTATDDDGSCTYAEEYYDCDGNCLSDVDGDLVYDENEIAGCQDSSIVITMRQQPAISFLVY